MATKKTTKTTKTPKSVKTPAKASRAKTTRKPKVRVDSVESMETFDELASAKPAVVSQPVNRRRTIMIATGVVIVGVLLFLAYRTLILAWVDQTPITRWSYYQQLDQQYGKTLKDQMISQQLLANEGKKKHLSVSDADVDAEISKIKQQVGGDDKFNQILSLQGLTMDKLRTELKEQLLVKKIFADQIQVSDDELNQYIAQNKAQLPAIITDEIKTQIKSQIESDKLNTVATKWLTEAKSSNRIILY